MTSPYTSANVEQEGSLAQPGSLLAHQQHNTEATLTSMCFWARAIGNRNPCFTEPSYASAIGGWFHAHPCWLYSVQDTIVRTGELELCPIVVGTDWRFDRPVCVGERIGTSVRLTEQRTIESEFAGTAVLQRIEVSFANRHGGRIAQAVSTLLNVEPARCRCSSRFVGWKRHRYTAAELAGIEADYDAEQVRGPEPRYWDDIQLEEPLPRIVRGPLTSEEMVLFIGANGPPPGGAAFSRLRAEGRMASFLHSRTGVFESHAASVVDDESARELGFPAAHDCGIDRISQLATLVTNWAGDGAFMTALTARLREPKMLGDTTWFRGRVVRKEESTAGFGLAHLALCGRNQRGQTTITGDATVRLPRRD